MGNLELTDIKNRLTVIEFKLNEYNSLVQLSQQNQQSQINEQNQQNQQNQINQSNLNNNIDDNYYKEEIDSIKNEINNINKKTE